MTAPTIAPGTLGAPGAPGTRRGGELPGRFGSRTGELGLAERARRLWATSAEAMRLHPEIAAQVRSALDRFDRPPLVRVLSCEGAGGPLLAATLQAAGLPEPEVLDIDELRTAAVELSVPDIAILCLCTWPCAHESAWIRRPRRHPLLVVDTRPAAHSPAQPPGWAQELLAVDVGDAAHPGTGQLIERIQGALATAPSRRTALLAQELTQLAARPESTKIIEPVLCPNREDRP